MYVNGFGQVGANIRKVLVSKKLNQSVLASKIGVSRQVMSKIINGTKAINVCELAVIADALGVSADALLSVDESKERTVNFMGNCDGSVAEKLNLIRYAVDEILFLEKVTGTCA